MINTLNDNNTLSLFIISLTSIILILIVAITLLLLYFHNRIRQFSNTLSNTFTNNYNQSFSNLKSDLKSELKESLLERITTFTQTLEQRLSSNQIQHIKEIASFQQTLSESLTKSSEQVSHKLQQISLQVEQRLNEGFEKTTATFTDIVKRLALIDDAQKKLTELSSNVVSLQEILSDKRSRGAFGEVQLKNLIQNVLPQENYAFQYTLSNGLRADCVLFLPPPTGNVVIDSKFPLENFQMMTDFHADDSERKKASQNFRIDIKKHITDISSKYIIPGETSDGALLFIPAEAVFAEIHAHFPDLVEFAQRSNVWLASPTTMMAILTTSSAVLKDNATREHIHVIQAQLRLLAQDFQRFETRMNQLSKHIDQAQQDVQQVHTSAKKISQRFTQIEKVDIGQSVILNTESSPILEEASSTLTTESSEY